MVALTAEERLRARELLRAPGPRPRITTEDGTVLDLPSPVAEALAELLEAAADGQAAHVLRSPDDQTTVSTTVLARLRVRAPTPKACQGTGRRWQTGGMAKSAATVRLDDEVLDPVRHEAARSGRSEDQAVETAVRRYSGPSVLDRLRERNRLGEHEAMEIARKEIAAHHRERRSA